MEQFEGRDDAEDPYFFETLILHQNIGIINTYI
jgi:hypothetical protein